MENYRRYVRGELSLEEWRRSRTDVEVTPIYEGDFKPQKK